MGTQSCSRPVLWENLRVVAVAKVPDSLLPLCVGATHVKQPQLPLNCRSQDRSGRKQFCGEKTVPSLFLTSPAPWKNNLLLTQLRAICQATR